MSRLEGLRPDQLDTEQRGVYAEIVGGRRSLQQLFTLRQPDDTLAGPFNAMLYAPAVGGPLSRLGEAIRYDSSLGAREREVAVLTVAAMCGAEYEWYAHERVGSALGLRPDEIDALRNPTTAVLPDEREEAVREVAVLLVLGDDIGPAKYQHLRDRLGVGPLVEVVALVGYYRLLADVLRLFDVGVPGSRIR